MTKERIEKLLKAGANVVLTTKGIDDMALKASLWIFDSPISISVPVLFAVSKLAGCYSWQSLPCFRPT